MDHKLHVRPARDADLPAITAIYAAARRFMAENGNPTQWYDGYPDETVIRSDMEKQQLYVCTDGDAVVGVFCYFFGIEPDYLDIYHGAWQCDAPYGVVHRVASTTKQRGIASFCLEYAFSQCGNLRIDTHRDNIPMQKLLEKNGFQRCGIVHCSHGGERIAYQKTQ